ncbi:MAG TPA: general secretion pathway protein GspF, partial [Cyanobacteria bacterium UBA8530]|nr:general secretion pathway protein GspF [Cyanobacteria bacterium UBA8530]
MDNAAKFSGREIDYKIKGLTTMIEPIMTIVMGIVVMGIALALYLPIFDLPKILMKG